ncbi:LOW QUALITY PROTEIN: uncharacterized protein LOC129289295, partial [Prosopis cineraria]|uniref:LOW QUALITY PROTEIN: uncharacterized protein LOC129289295 n=1 Tax=Prosopis cineraria TaxID=364024 RepID=UPI00240EE1D1
NDLHLLQWRPLLSRFSDPAIRSSIKPEPSNRKQVATNWWAPLFGMSSEPDYIDGTARSQAVEALGSNNEPVRPRSKFAGCFTEEKAKQLRMKTMETTTFHDIMYHSAIASRLASDVSKRFDK